MEHGSWSLLLISTPSLALDHVPIFSLISLRESDSRSECAPLLLTSTMAPHCLPDAPPSQALACFCTLAQAARKALLPSPPEIHPYRDSEWGWDQEWPRSLDQTHLVRGRNTPCEERVTVHIECEHDDATSSSTGHNQEQAQLVDEQGPVGRCASGWGCRRSGASCRSPSSLLPQTLTAWPASLCGNPHSAAPVLGSHHTLRATPTCRPP